MLDTIVQLRPRGSHPNRSPNAAVAMAATPKHTAMATAAVSAFLSEMVEFGAGCELQWKRVAASYNSMRAERGWPELQDQKLSHLLMTMGCSHRRVRTPKGRLTLIGFPLEFGEPLAMAS